MKTWLNDQWEWLKSFLSEPINGGGVQKASSKRIASLAVTWTFVFVYVKTALASNALPEIPDTWVFIIGTVLGINGLIDFFKTKTEKKV